MRAGGILYYDAIPDTIRTDVHPIPITDQNSRNQRFWKMYIDEVLGLEQWGFTTTNGVRYASYNNYAGRMGYGNFFSWPSKQTNIWASGRGMENATPAPTVTRWKWGRDSAADNR